MARVKNCRSALHKASRLPLARKPPLATAAKNTKCPSAMAPKPTAQQAEKSKKKPPRAKAKRQTWTVAAMESALDEIHQLVDNQQSSIPTSTPAERKAALGQLTGFKGIARRHRVPRITLRDRWISNPTDPSHKAGTNTVLTAAQETSLAQLILERQRCGFPFSVNDARGLVYQFCERNTIPHHFNHQTKVAGWKWWANFRKRHAEIVLRKAEGLSLNRALGMERHRIQEYFQQLGQVLDSYGVMNVPELIYNVDETGIQVVNDKGKCLAEKGCKQVQQVTSAERGATHTVIACCNAEGFFIPPMIIFNGTKLRNKDQLASGFPAGTLISCSKSGWVDKELFLEWFHHFVLNLPPRGNRDVVLIMDNHPSHSSPQLLAEAAAERVALIRLPSHTSNHLQPLDVSVYGPFKRSWGERCRWFVANNPGAVIQRNDIGSLFTAAYRKHATAQNAISGFRKTGLCPFDLSAIPDSAFAISDAILSTGPSQQQSNSTAQQQSPRNVPESGSPCSQPTVCRPQVSPILAEPGSANFPAQTCEPTTPGFINLQPAQVNSTPNESSVYTRPGNDSFQGTVNFSEKDDSIELGVQSALIALYSPQTAHSTSSPSNTMDLAVDPVSFHDLIPPLDTNASASRDQLKRMRVPKLSPKKACASTSQSILPDKRAGLSRQKSPLKVSRGNKFICQPCGADYDNDKSGIQWFQCMECRRWEHFTCGGCSTTGTFFCTSCIPRIMKLLSGSASTSSLS